MTRTASKRSPLRTGAPGSRPSHGRAAGPAARPPRFRSGFRALFLGNANLGFDARANEIANSFRRSWGKLAYVLAGLKALTSEKPHLFRTETLSGNQGREEILPFSTSRTGWFLAACSSGMFGGGLLVAPEAKLDDGLIHLRTATDAGRLGIVRAFLPALIKHPRTAPGTHMESCVQVRIDADPAPGAEPLRLYADGDLVGLLPAEIGIRPGAVTILASAYSEAFIRPGAPEASAR